MSSVERSPNETASSLHQQAARDHQDAANHHRNAARCHDQNKVSEAKASSSSAMECCNAAQSRSMSACECSAL